MRAPPQPKPPPIPAACEDVALPLERGQETQIGHYTTVASFGADWVADVGLDEEPAPDQAVIVLATHADYDCDHLLDSFDLDHSYLYSGQFVYLLPGPLEPGTYEDLPGWNASYLGDGQGNGGGGANPFTDGRLTITEITDDCVTGIKPFSDTTDYGFAITATASCP
ncbi:MAG: hypothetical protein KDK70_03000 [Myxococcales bacterium]|nr:hypothetical protein [Myxococcales bacterium]